MSTTMTYQNERLQAEILIKVWDSCAFFLLWKCFVGFQTCLRAHLRCTSMITILNTPASWYAIFGSLSFWPVLTPVTTFLNEIFTGLYGRLQNNRLQLPNVYDAFKQHPASVLYSPEHTDWKRQVTNHQFFSEPLQLLERFILRVILLRKYALLYHQVSLNPWIWFVSNCTSKSNTSCMLDMGQSS